MIRFSLTTELYDPKTFFTHAALLVQGSPHWRKFPTAASRRSLGRVSVPMWPFALSGRLRIVALVCRYHSNQLMRRRSIHVRTFAGPLMNTRCLLFTYPVLATVSSSYPGHMGRLPTCYSPVRHWALTEASFHIRSVRLACIRHAASVHPEPGSNSPLSFYLFRQLWSV